MNDENTLLRTDVYKIGHARQYPDGIEVVYSALVARSSKVYPASVAFGGNFYLKEFLVSLLKPGQDDMFLYYADAILGKGTVKPEQYRALVKLGYWPLKIKSLPEGTLVKNGNVLMTIVNTDRKFPWAVGFVEGLLLKVWNTGTVATNSFKLRKVAEAFALHTTGGIPGIEYAIHDFGYRGCSSEETAALGGAAHLLSFKGSDTVTAVRLLDRYYNADRSTPVDQIANSVPASEHSVMTAFGEHGELEAFHHMLDLYPTGIVSIVSDSYNFWDVVTKFIDPAVEGSIYQRVIERDGKTVFRPDSGNPELVILGDPNAPEGSPEHAGALELLWARFGGTVNQQGFRVLNPKVGLIYGDGIYYDRMVRIYAAMVKKGFATSNIVFGIGGLLLQQFSRDVLGYAIKATYVEIAGQQRNIMKDPITDPGKRSHKGLVRVDFINGVHVTRDQVSWDEEDGGLLETVFINGKIVKEYNLQQIRQRLQSQVIPDGFVPTIEELLNVSLEVPLSRDKREISIVDEVAALAARYATRPLADQLAFLNAIARTEPFGDTLTQLSRQLFPSMDLRLKAGAAVEENAFVDPLDKEEDGADDDDQELKPEPGQEVDENAADPDEEEDIELPNPAVPSPTTTKTEKAKGGRPKTAK